MRAAWLTMVLAVSAVLTACGDEQMRLIPVQEAWAKNSINGNILRHNSVASWKEFQYTAFYDSDGHVVLARRKLGSSQWRIRETDLRGNINDAHNVISIMVDGNGFLHLAWDHHGHPLRYCRTRAVDSLSLTEMMPMTGQNEDNVTYPEFYRLPDGDLLFFYRDGASGSGSLMMNHYDRESKKWTQRQNAFISGEGKRNPYWQLCTDQEGTIHVSWVWRESPDVASNHDMGYAKSTDGGITWLKSDGTPYTLPITIDTAEYAARIPRNHALINTTAMCADADGHPYIATYWRPEGETVPQYHLIHHDGTQWRIQQVGQRTKPFSLSGDGTKRIPIARCQILADTSGDKTKAYLIFRDEERNNRVSVAICNDLESGHWTVKDLTDFSVGMWEPSYDTELWKSHKVLHLYTQNVEQGDSESTKDLDDQMVYILEWKPDTD